MKAILNTNMGAIEIELNEEKAPISVKNFVDYVESGHYNGTVFHRIINDFMIQGGGFDINMKQKPTRDEIKNEANNGLTNDKYTVAMARTMVPHSASSQFFINVKDNDFLNFKSEDTHGWGYAVFGKIVGGQDIIEKIKQVKTGSNGMHDDVPLEAVVIETATIMA
jgi:peptidyl-prolyl cis-trans isomerase B (cyclophilin B)